MKNIHVLPTDKPSRTYKIDSIGKLDWSEGYLHQVDGATNQNIYITYDEEIKEGDYILIHGHYKYEKHVTKVIKITDTYEVIEGGNHSKKVCQKIILTTDVDLIKDDVQAIDDEFLEWFVNNPSCKKVEISSNWHMFSNKNTVKNYGVIIPKEELTMVDKLKEYFENTSEEQIQKDWDETCKQTEGIISPTNDEEFRSIDYWKFAKTI